MKKRIALSFWITLITFSLFAQLPRIHPDPGLQVSSQTERRDFSTKCLGSTRPQSVDLKWRPILNTRFQSFEPEGPDAERIEAMKSAKQLEKRSQPGGSLSENSIAAVVPAVGTNFLGNINNGSSPLDNNIAISDGGIIVSVANTSVEIDDDNGANLYYQTIVDFYNDPLITNVCDPVVLYDRPADRFIFFAQECSGVSANSKLLICFSKSNNPATDGWWKYKISGNPLSDASWFDYPKMAVSSQELCITGNLFFEAGGYNQSVIYQISKANGYSGGNIGYTTWSNISGSPFTLLPLSDGHGGAIGPGFYLVATASGGSSVIDLYDLTDVRTASPVLNHYAVSTTAYSPAADSDQSGTTCQLDNGDSRALSGFYLNGIIHFVFHSDIGSGWNGINYNRLSVGGTPSNTSRTFGSVGNFDYSYPSIASFGTSVSDKSVMIGFGRVSSAITPQVRVVNCDDAMNFSSSVLVKQSDDFVSYTSSTKERWGDYTGMARRHGAGAPTVWMNGMYGTASNKWNTWIAEIGAGAVGVQSVAEIGKMSLYPNPVVSTFSLEFDLAKSCKLEIKIIDAGGKIVKELYKGVGRPGTNVFSFNEANLTAGTYFINISTPSTILKNEKIIVAR